MISNRWTAISTRGNTTCAFAYREALLVILLLATNVAMAFAEMPPEELADDGVVKNHPSFKDHPIFDVSRSLFDDSSHTTDEVHAQLRLTLKLLKRRVAIGEPAWGVLQIENLSDKITYRLTPPYIGSAVATSAVWRARADPLAGRHWGEVRLCIPLNKAYLRHEMIDRLPDAWFDGVPVKLEPGKSLTATVPINVAQQINDPESLGKHWWFGGIGMTLPGFYHVYVQYSNLGDPILPKADEHGTRVLRSRTNNLAVKADDDRPQDVPWSQAIVSNSVDIEVVLPKTSNPDRLTALVRRWESAALIRSDAMEIPNVEEITPVLASLDPSEKEIRDSMKLTSIRAGVSACEADLEKSRARLESLLKSCMEARDAIKEDPIADAYGLTTCYILRALKRETDALDTARKLNTPDSAAFIKFSPADK